MPAYLRNWDKPASQFKHRQLIRSCQNRLLPQSGTLQISYALFLILYLSRFPCELTLQVHFADKLLQPKFCSTFIYCFQEVAFTSSRSVSSPGPSTEDKNQSWMVPVIKECNTLPPRTIRATPVVKKGAKGAQGRHLSQSIDGLECIRLHQKQPFSPFPIHASTLTQASTFPAQISIIAQSYQLHYCSLQPGRHSDYGSHSYF